MAKAWNAYLLGDPGYTGADMFVMRRIGRHECGHGEENDIVSAFKMMHSGRRIIG
jgi:hypothetical protein